MGSDFTYYMDTYANTAAMWIAGEDIPRETSRITLNHDVKDPVELPVTNVHYDDHPNDIAMRNHAFMQGEAIYTAAGAAKTLRTPPYPSTHYLGTCRMSAKPSDGVCNKHGQTFGVPKLLISDGSQFTTSAAENPTLIIVTLAIRQSDYIADQMKRRISRKQWLAKRSKRPKRPAGTAARRFLLQCQELSMCRIYAQTDPILYECRARSVRMSGVTTTIRLENVFWQTLSELAADNDMTTNQLIAKLHEEVTQHLGETTNFASFVRVICLRYQGLRANASTDFRSHVAAATTDKVTG